MENKGPAVSRSGVDKQGIAGAGTVYWNLSPARLVELAITRGEAALAADGPAGLPTPASTPAGRPTTSSWSRSPATERRHLVGQGQPARSSSERSRRLLARGPASTCGARTSSSSTAMPAPIRATACRARDHRERLAQPLRPQHVHPRAGPAELAGFEPGFTVLDVADLQADPAADGTRTGDLHPARPGAAHGADRRHPVRRRDQEEHLLRDELLLPQAGRAARCTAAPTTGADKDDVALFFGLSGTGKTTLSADPERTLIGDDEHGWSDDGVFNVEGGCYAKVIRLSQEGEPEIYATTRRFGTVLENVVSTPRPASSTSTTTALTENTRVELPAHPARQRRPRRPGGPPAATSSSSPATPSACCRRSPADRRSRRCTTSSPATPPRWRAPSAGVTEPQVDLQHLLRRAVPAAPPRRLRRDAGREARRAPGAASGWSTPAGRAAPTASASGMKLGYTRRMVTAALDRRARRRRDLDRPDLRPRRAGAASRACRTSSSARARPGRAPPDYDAQAGKLADMFADNFEKYESGVDEAVKAAGPRQGEGVADTRPDAGGRGLDLIPRPSGEEGSS